MKRFLCLFCASAALAAATEISAVQKVYLMPMARAFDQYLASRLTSGHVFLVVTDPKLADAFFTDRVGEGLESQLEAIFPPPEPKEPPAAEAKKAAPATAAEAAGLGALVGQTVNKVPSAALNSSFGRAKGTVFLVEAKSRVVIWSVYEPARDSRSQTLDRAAAEVVERLKKDLRLK